MYLIFKYFCKKVSVSLYPQSVFASHCRAVSSRLLTGHLYNEAELRVLVSGISDYRKQRNTHFPRVTPTCYCLYTAYCQNTNNYNTQQFPSWSRKTCCLTTGLIPAINTTLSVFLINVICTQMLNEHRQWTVTLNGLFIYLFGPNITFCLRI